MNEQLEFVKSIASRLERAGISYMLTGSTAMAMYAAPRVTRDIDVVIECDVDDVERVHELFKPDCYVDLGAIREAVAGRRMFNVIHDKWLVKADFMVRKNEPYRVTEFGRRRQLDVEGSKVFVVSAEDLILSKLLWSKESESARQRRDARSVVEAIPDLDWEYLEKWANALEVKDLLAEVRKR
ncbi:MAG: DUF6036 family nucleotidyltransferase [bacterium]